MSNDEDAVVLNFNAYNQDCEDRTEIQTEESRKIIERELCELNDDSGDTDIQTTIRLSNDHRPYWKRLFG